MVLFSERITATSLTSLEADTYFGNRIKCKRWSFDVTLPTILRAIIYPKMGARDSLSVHFHLTYPDWVYNDTPPYDSVVIIDVGNRDFVSQATHDFKTNYKYAGEYVEVEKFHQFFTRYFFPGRLLLCPKRRSSMLFCANIDIESLHAICFGVPYMVPWITANKPLTQRDKELLFSLCETGPSRFFSKVDEIAQTLGLPSNPDLSVAYDFLNTTDMYKIIIDDLARELQQCRTQYESLWKERKYEQ